MEVDSYCVSCVDNIWEFYCFILFFKEEMLEDYCWYDIRLIYWCFDIFVVNE